MKTKEVATIMNSSERDLEEDKVGSIISSSHCDDRWFQKLATNRWKEEK